MGAVEIMESSRHFFIEKKYAKNFLKNKINKQAGEKNFKITNQVKFIVQTKHFPLLWNSRSVANGVGLLLNKSQPLLHHDKGVTNPLPLLQGECKIYIFL